MFLKNVLAEGIKRGFPGLAAGGMVTGPVFRQLGEAGKEAVLPLNAGVMKQLAGAITAQMGAPGAGAGRTVIEHQTVVLPPTPGGDTMGDPTLAALQFSRELSRRGAGAPA